MGLDKKFQNALDKGLAPRRQEETLGIIELTKEEIVTKGRYEYIYKIKVPREHTRVYGHVGENGDLVFDYILKKWGD